MSHKITRRNFLRIGTLGTAAGILAGCQNPRRWVILEPYVKPPEEQIAGVATWYASTCKMCPAGCGIIVRLMNGRASKIEGNPEHPLNQGKLCARGQSGLQLLYNPDRLNSPVTQSGRGTHNFQAIQWNEGINTLFTKLQAAGSKVAVWGGSGMSAHLNALFGLFAKAIGAPDPIYYDTYLGMSGYSALRAADQTLFGQHELPTYDLGSADVILSFNADPLGPQLSQVRYGIEYGKFRSQADGKRGYLVQIEPRMSLTGAKADLWLPVKPGSEGIIAQAIIRIIADQGIGDVGRVARAKAYAGTVDLQTAVDASGLSLDQLNNLARIFRDSEKPLAIPGGALAGYPNAVESLTAVQALNAIAGTSGSAGSMSLSSETIWPENIVKPVTTPFADVQAMIQKMHNGEIEVLLVHSANPLYDLPAQAGLADALSKVPFIVSFAPMVDETAVQADMILPDATYLESWGYDITSPAFGVPVLSSQQPVVTPFTDTRSTADILLTIAQGIPNAAKALPWSDEVAFLKETITQLPASGTAASGPDVLWARYLQHGGWWPAGASINPASQGSSPKPVQVSAPQYQGDPNQYPYFLHMYISDLLSDGRGANLPWLQGSPAPLTTGAYQTLVEMNPDTAQQAGLQDGDAVKVASPNGEVEGYIYTYPAMRPDTVAIATGQGHTEYGRYAQGRGSNPMQLAGGQVDPSGNGLLWSNLRVNVTKTGPKVALALFEWKPGVEEGFPNAAFPGE